MMLMDDIHAERYDGTAPGPHLVIFGGIHGNEPCGPVAIQRACDELENGTLAILRGSVTLVPICNPAAHAENRRFIEEDLNRIFRQSDLPASYESRLANKLAALVDDADVLLDIHSTAAPGPVSVFIDFPTERNKALAESLGAKYALLNWPELYEDNEFFDSYDTTRYSFEAGKDGVLIECGQHGDPDAVSVAYDSILRSLRHLGMIGVPDTLPANPPMHSIKMVRLEQKRDADDMLMERWEHLQRIPQGTVIATRATGEEIAAETDCVMLLPKYSALPGGEWFYLGIEI